MAKAIKKWLPHEVDNVKTADSVDKLAVEVAIFDYDGLIERLIDDAEFIKKITTMFIGEMPKQIDALKQAVSVGDSKKAELYAHSMKGSADNIGTNQFRNVAAELEKAGKAADFARITNLIPELEKQFDTAVKAINNKISQL